MSIIIVNQGLALLGPDEHAGKYLAEYDPDAHGGRGHIRWTADPGRAMQFPHAAAAWECWRQQSRVHPLRPDGKPNRPLTAYTVSVQDAAEAVTP